MTLERKYHVIAISLIVLGIAAGGVCWVVDGTAFWVACGLSLALLVVGLYFGGRASSEERKYKEQ